MATLDTRTAPQQPAVPSLVATDALHSRVPQASPDAIRAAAHLYGVRTAKVETARVIELGCGSGVNLLPFALSYPHSRITGVDLDDESIASGVETLKQLGVENIQLATASLDEVLNTDLGLFDYVIVHGHFGAVNESIRGALLEWAQRHLNPQGIICMAWNAYPGWKAAETLRDAFQLHGSLAETQEQRLASARAMLTYLSLGSAEKNPLNAALKPLIQHAESQSDLSLALSYLEGINEPCYLVDFNAVANRSGLAYVGDLFPHTELPQHYGEQVAKLTATISPDANNIVRQQYLDFSVGRSQRVSLLVPENRADSILPAPELQRVKDFHWAGSFQREVTDDALVTNSFRSGKNAVIGVNHDLALHVMDVICDAWPQSVSFEQLVFNTLAPERENEIKQHRKDVLDVLEMLFTRGIDELHVSLQESGYNLSTCSSLQLLPALKSLWHDKLVADGTLVGFNLWHENIALKINAQEMGYLALLMRNDAELPLNEDCYAFIERLRSAGVLWGNPSAWLHYFQQLLLVFSAKSERYLGSLIMYASETSVGGYKKPTGNISKKRSTKASIEKPLDKTVYRDISALIDAHDFAEARHKVEALVKAHPSSIHGWHLLAQTNLKTGAYDEALKALMKTLALHSGSWSVYLDAAHVYWHTDKYYYAGRLTRKILRCDPRNVASWNLLSALYKQTGDVIQAEICMRKAESLAPKDANVLSNLASLLSSQGRMPEAIECFRRMRALAPDNYTLHSNYLFSLSHDATLTPEVLFEEHCEFGDLVMKNIQRYQRQFTHPGLRDPNRKLRIGFVSGDLGQHPVTNFLKPFWDNINREHFSLYAFATSNLNDDATKQLQQSAEGWHSVYDMSDIELAELINREQIDILFDLSGHTGYNRLPMFGFKPAPVQISWIGYPGTTGLRTMDYFLILNLNPLPESFDRQFVEKIIYARSEQQFTPHENSPEVNSLPAISKGYLTFGSLNRMQKLNDKMLKLWAEILRALPDSKFIIGALQGQKNIEIVRNKLESYGVLPNQMIFKEKMPIHDYLALHHEIDVLLDTFPYTGGTTTNHALWMGVPTLTLSGQTLPTQQGVAALSWLGLEEFIAYSDTDYVSKAISWGDRLDELNHYRQTMRQKFQCDKREGITPATHFERLLRSVWRDYCDGKPTKAHAVGF